MYLPSQLQKLKFITLPNIALFKIILEWTAYFVLKAITFDILADTLKLQYYIYYCIET
jgi:hypothetical protein